MILAGTIQGRDIYHQIFDVLPPIRYKHPPCNIFLAPRCAASGASALQTPPPIATHWRCSVWSAVNRVRDGTSAAAPNGPMALLLRRDGEWVIGMGCKV